MARHFVFIAALAISGIFVSGRASASGPGLEKPKLDKPKLETYLRYAEAYNAGVKFTFDDPVPSAYPGYYRLLVHISLNGHRGDKFYYVTADGEHILSSPIWDIEKNPFLDTLERLPMNGPSFGPEAAKVTVVIFSDFQCPYCRGFAKTVRDNVPKQYPNDVRVVFQDFPLEAIHPWARAAAEASHCVADQKSAGFWSYHDWIYEHQGEVTQANLREKVIAFAKDQKLDVDKLSSCMDTHAEAKKVNASIAAAEALEVSQTPTSFVNGRMVGGNLSWASLNSVIQLEMNRPKEIPSPASQAPIGR